MTRPAGTAVEKVVTFLRVQVSGCVAMTDNGLEKMTRYAKVERNNNIRTCSSLIFHIGLIYHFPRARLHWRSD